ncbi:hypothetical protein AMS68_000051 [Peltaster fructicola]|uniref:54S ribosomal protein L31, mitochondrial n=1 Tax=Peltaster fructicola TaxID=286661 RepID=A0A6H0XIJ6_9PEZI|nr:hypothetical protein AMS68_000051 [Peltaster fructicola]
MLGAFRPSAPLSGGLLWKIPWRLSPSQKFRHRRRMRRVDNVVAVLDDALKRDATTFETASIEAKAQARAARSQSSSKTTAQEERRHGKGPKQGDFVPERAPASTIIENPPMVQRATSMLLTDAARAQGTFKRLERWKEDMPTEAEMLPRDKYSMFDRKVRGYRKGVHKLPKWTRVSQRLNPPGF